MTNTTISFLEKYLGIVMCGLLTIYRNVWRRVFGESKTVKPTQRIVFVKFIEQGAFVLHLSTFREAEVTYGKENIYICTFASNKELLLLMQVVPEANIITIYEGSITSFARGFLNSVVKIRTLRIDTAIDLEFFSCASAAFSYLSGCTKRVGYHRYKGSQNYRGDLFTHRLNYSHYVHLAESSWTMLKCLETPVSQLPALNLKYDEVKNEVLFTPTEQDTLRLNAILNQTQNQPRIIINPSLNDALPLRKWPAESYKALVKRLNESFPGHLFIFTGREDEHELTNRFMDNLGIAHAINLCGKTSLRDVFTLYSQSKLLVTSDSGPAHFASLTTINSIVLFGPETPELYGPKCSRTKIVYKKLPCSPCFNAYNNRLSPCSNNICMQQISVNTVFDLSKEILQTK